MIISDGLGHPETWAHDTRVCVYGCVELSRSRNGGELTVDSFPDKLEREQPAVDLVAHDSVGVIVGEHTAVESYAGQIHDNVRIQQVFDTFPDRFAGRLPKPGRYTLVLSTRDGHEFPRAAREDAALRTVEEWICRQCVPVAQPPRQFELVSADPPDVPMSLTLIRARTTPEWDGTLYVAFNRPPDIEDQRIDRIRVALDAKCPKLAVTTPPGATSLLVLELRDYILGSPHHLAAAVYRASEGRDDVPSDICCVDTGAGFDAESAWLPYHIRRHHEWSNAARYFEAKI